MRFNQFLTSYYPDPDYGAKRHFDDLIAQAVLADRLGFDAVSLPEHHLINILMMPSPLQMAVKLTGLTDNIDLVTAVAVLPLRDMRIFAGEVAQADILCDGRLVLGVGRGAFGYEMARLGTPIEISREKFDESLDVLKALLEREDVAWSGKYYQFEPLTTMPRPMRPVPMMLAAMAPEAIYHSAKRGFHIQTSALQATLDSMLGQTDAFRAAKAELGEDGKHLRLAMQRVTYCRARRGRRQGQADPRLRVLRPLRQRLHRPGRGQPRPYRGPAAPADPGAAGPEPADLPAGRDGRPPLHLPRGRNRRVDPVLGHGPTPG